jgi:putative DNA primase/helicase
MLNSSEEINTLSLLRATIAELTPFSNQTELVAANDSTVTSHYDEAVDLPKLKEALDKISPDTGRGLGSVNLTQIIPTDYWLGVIWACASTKSDKVKAMAKQWSQRSARYTEDGFESAWEQYDPFHVSPIGLGSVFKLASRLQHDPSNAVYLSDMANSRRFAEKFRDKLLGVKHTSKWLYFDPAKGWVQTDHLVAVKLAKTVVEDMANEATRNLLENPDSRVNKDMLNEVKRASKKPNLEAMIQLSLSEEGMSVDCAELDADNFLLGVQNGVVDLDTGKLLPVTTQTLVTKRANVMFDTNAECPRFEQFLREIFPDSAEREAVVRILGYILTGSVNEQLWFFFKGTGSNGKSVLLELMAYLMGDYSSKIQTEMLMQHKRNSQGASPDLVSLQGRRLIYCNETTEGQRLDDARVKDLTGGDTITGRVPYAAEAVTFFPTHKLVMAGNYAPIVTDDGQGFWRRVVLINFSQRFSEQSKDPQLLDKLKRESSGILNYLLAGLKQWRDGGLNLPDSMTHATREYQREQDVVGEWLESNTEECPHSIIRKQALYENYKLWAMDCGLHPLSRQRWSRKLTDRGLQTLSDRRSLQGLRLKSLHKHTL